MSPRVGQVAFTLFATLALFHCSSSKSNGVGGTATIPGAERVVSADGNLTIDVPEGALPNGEKVTIAISQDAPPGHVGPAYEISPSGVHLAKPVMLTFKNPSGVDAATLSVARAVNGTWKRLREAMTLAGTTSALTDHFSEYGIVSAPVQFVSAQASRWADACQVDCPPIATSCIPPGSPPTPSLGGCAVLEPDGWAASEEKKQLACIEDGIGFGTPKKVRFETGPCGQCIRDCCTPALRVSQDFDACICGLNTEAQTAAWFECATKCVGLPSSPGPNEVCGSGGDTYYVTPTVSNMMGGVAEPGSVHHGSEVIVRDLTDPTGLALDEAGNLFFGEMLQNPVRVVLRKRAPDGTITDLGNVVDTSSGGVASAWGFDIAVSPTGEVAYNTPQIRGSFESGGALVQDGSIRKLGGSELAGNVGGDPAGLAYDNSGNLYFGVKRSTGLVQWKMMKRSAGGQVSDLGIVVDTTADTGVSEGWKLDIAATKSGDVYYTTPAIVAVPNGGTGGGGGTGASAKSSVRKLGGQVVFENDLEIHGIAFDASDNLYYGEQSSNPMRIQLKKRAPDGTTTDLGRAVDTSIGFVRSTWPFDVTVPR